MRSKIHPTLFRFLTRFFLCIALICMGVLLLSSRGILSCPSCHNETMTIPILGFVYFSVLLILTFTHRSALLKVSPYGLLFASSLALCMQLTLLTPCLLCFIAHIAHVVFWSLFFVRCFGMTAIPTSLILVSIFFPLFHFRYPPTKLNFEELGFQNESKGYVVTIVQPGCHFCAYELPYFATFSETIKKQGVSCLILSTGETEEVNKPFKELARGMNIKTYSATMLQPQCTIHGYPFFLFADSSGRVVATSVGLPEDVEHYLNETVSLILP